MVFPAFYFKYNGAFSYKFTIEAASIDGAKIAFGYNFSDNFNLKLVANVGGYAAYLKRNGRKEIFTQQNIITGLQPEFKIGKHLSIPIIVGAKLFAFGCIPRAQTLCDVQIRS